MQYIEWIRLLGIGGGLVSVLGALVSGAAYTGKAGERYSPLNHFISELGEVGVSRLAWVFNAAMILAGLLLLPCCILLGLLIPGWLSKLGMVAGVSTSIVLGLVGVFPMNRLQPHIRVAMTFFRLGLAMALLFTIAIAAQSEPSPAVPRAAALAGAPAILAYAAFILYSDVTTRGTGASGLEANFAARPRVWRLAILEWMIFLTTVLWFGAIALIL